MTSKINYGFLAIAMVAIFGLSVAPVMNSAYATTTYVGSFTNNHVCILNGVDPAYNSGVSNNDGDLDLSADTDGTSGDQGTVHAFALKKLYFSAGSVSILARATVDADNTSGYNHVKAFVSPASEYEYSALLGCWKSGSAVSGSSADMLYLGPGGSDTGLIVGTSSFTIPSAGWYNVIIYADAQTQTNGGPSHTEIDNPLIRLTY